MTQTNILPSKARIIGDNVDSDKQKNHHGFDRLDRFYLHGQCQDLNGYDIFDGNIDCFKQSLKNHLFLAKARFTNGDKREVLVMPTIQDNRIVGLVCLLTDIQMIKDVLICCKIDRTISHDQKIYLRTYHNELFQILFVD